MKFIANLLILIALGSVLIGVVTKFTGCLILFPDVAPQSYLIVANTFLLLALVLKLANE